MPIVSVSEGQEEVGTVLESGMGKVMCNGILWLL